MTTKRPTAIILTATELRHDFFSLTLALDEGLEVLLTIRERKESLSDSAGVLTRDDARVVAHAESRSLSERDFFAASVGRSPDRRNGLLVPKGSINNDPSLHQLLRDLDPDVLICYGTSIIREPVLGDFAGRFLNVHLGLSPYYRGAGTNFWPLVNREPEFVGVTFMHIDSGVDTGRVVHQARAFIRPDDSSHSLGNRLIYEMTHLTAEVARNLQKLPAIDQSEMNPMGLPERVYRRRDFDGRAVEIAGANIANGLLREYLHDKEERDSKAPIVDHERYLR